MRYKIFNLLKCYAASADECLPVYRSVCLQDPTNKDGCESLSTGSINDAMHCQLNRAILVCYVIPDGKTE